MTRTWKKGTGNRQRRVHKHAGNLGQSDSFIWKSLNDGCQGEGLTVTSACDLAVVCHLGLCLLHAVIAKGWHSSNRLTHAPGFFVPFRRSPRSTTVEFWRVFYAPRALACQNGHDAVKNGRLIQE